MRPGLLLGGAWVLSTAVAVTVAVQGVGFVGREVTDERPAVLSGDEVRAALRAGEADSEPTATTSPSTTTVAAAPGPVTTVASPSSGARRPPAPTSGSGTTASGASGGSGSVGTPAPVPAASTRTYTLVGGSASIRFEPGKVTVLWATPNSGYEVDVETYAADRVEVRFRSASHESEVTAWWDGGPRDEVAEEDRSSGSGSD